MAVLAASASDMQGQVTADQIKAAYMFNFAKFIEWPAEALAGAASLNFCALGRSATVDEVDSLVSGKSINSRPIKIRHLGKPEEIKDCHLVFLAGSAGKQEQKLFQAAKGLPILLVGESPGFAHAGGTIGFLTENGKVLFEINISSAEEAHLKISSKLLALARIVSSGIARPGQ
jgi:hypothetical protein